MTYTVDASVYVSSLRPTDANHLASADLLSELEKTVQEVVVPTLVLPECAGAVGRASNDAVVGQRAGATIRVLKGHTFVSLTIARAERASQLAAAYKLRGADSVYVQVAREFGTTLITWDNEMFTRASAVVTTMTPSDWLAQNPTSTN